MTRPPDRKLVKIPRERLHRLHHKLQHRLPLWCVFRPGTDEYPDHWVARLHLTIPDPRPTRFVIAGDTLTQVRDALPVGMICIGRCPEDPVGMVEVWL